PRRQQGKHALEHDHVARPQADIAQAFAEAYAAAADGQEVDRIAFVQFEPPGRLADQDRTLCDDRLDHADLVVGRSRSERAVLPLKFERLPGDRALERVGRPFEQYDITFAQDHVARGA